MLKKENQPKSINFLDSTYAKKDILANAYIWLVSVGKYMLIVVQIFVLGVFFSRFVVDRRNNDLTEEINNKVVLLSNESWKKNSILFANYQVLLSDVKSVSNAQDTNSTQISEIINGIPSLLTLDAFSYNEGSVSLRLKSFNLDAVNSYETALKNNSDYKEVKFSISKRDSEISIGVTFDLNISD